MKESKKTRIWKALTTSFFLLILLKNNWTGPIKYFMSQFGDTRRSNLSWVRSVEYDLLNLIGVRNSNYKQRVKTYSVSFNNELL